MTVVCRNLFSLRGLLFGIGLIAMGRADMVKPDMVKPDMGKLAWFALPRASSSPLQVSLTIKRSCALEPFAATQPQIIPDAMESML
jgi:hypothetical protein